MKELGQIEWDSSLNRRRQIPMMEQKCVFVCACVQFVGVRTGLYMLHELEVHERNKITSE